MKKLNGSHTFPYIYSYREGHGYVIETIVRIKRKPDGKWHLWLIRRTVSNPEWINDEIKRVVAEAYRTMLFGVVPEDIKSVTDSSGNPFFELDDVQYSEHGKMYIENGLMFIKSKPPYPTGDSEIDKELLQIWEEKYKPRI